MKSYFVALVGIALSVATQAGADGLVSASLIEDLGQAVPRCRELPRHTLERYREELLKAVEALPATYDCSSLFRLVSHDSNLERDVLKLLSLSKYPFLRSQAVSRAQLILRLRSQAPSFSGTTFDGRELSLADFRGRVVLVSIWSDTCAPCIDELPKLEKLYRQYEKYGFVVVGFNVVRNAVEMARSKKFLDRANVTFPNFPIVGDLSVARVLLSDFGFYSSVGVYFLLDQDGKLVSNDVGGAWFEPELRLQLGLLAHEAD